MRNKTLKSYTIIPPEMYIERAADRQISQLVEDMGRPGYVLVARQMGKTNLLLNAKRQLGAGIDTFVYLDVSNGFPDLRSFFRNITDTIVDAISTIHVASFELISNERAKSDRLPHKEHEWELRTILNLLPGKLVICLDEIDALTGLIYSDQVFSFIRSVYFSGRANFPEFNSLTYLLSGVAEPSDIIKNKDISPFNIGEKIYLSGFSGNELRIFLEKARLSLRNDVISRIYEWTRGHPRMTWDVCARIESLDGEILVSDVDAAVAGLYFSDVDFPPVDHIKNLAESNRDIRDAIVSMHYKRSESISDNVRTKLYLAGVSQFNPATKEVLFANKVLEDALSENYIMSLDSKHRSLDKILVKIHAREYGGALTELTDFLSHTADPVTSGLTLFWIALCNFHIGEYKRAVQGFADVKISLSPAQNYLRSFFVGSGLFFTSDFGEAEPHLQKVVDAGINKDIPAAFWESVVFLARCYIETENHGIEETLALLEMFLDKEDEFFELDGATQPAAETITTALASYALLLKSIGKTEEAKQAIRRAVSNSVNGNTLIKALGVQFDVETANHIKKDALTRGVEIIRRFDRVAPHENSEGLTLATLLEFMNRLEKAGRTQDLDVCLDHLFEVLPTESVSDLMAELRAITGQSELAGRIVDRVLVNSQSKLSPSARRELSALVIVFDERRGVARYGIPYLRSFEDDSVLPNAAKGEIKVLYSIFMEGIRTGNYEYCDAAYSVLSRVPDRLEKSNRDEATQVKILVDFLGHLISLKRNPTSSVIGAARAFSIALAEVRHFVLPWFSADSLISMRSHLAISISGLKAAPEKRARKIGRNEIVTVSYDGQYVKGKFKKFESDIAQGVCLLVNESAK